MDEEKMSDVKSGVGGGKSARPDKQPSQLSNIDNNELFTSDEFRMYCMKVLPCSKRYTHNWPSCPFAHPGEKAKRRDPRTHQYDCEMCPAVLKGEVCELGAACPHSHHVFESFLHPQKYRTLLCKDGEQCHREVCFFAHGAKQLRTPDRGQQQPLPQQRYGPLMSTDAAMCAYRQAKGAPAPGNQNSRLNGLAYGSQTSETPSSSQFSQQQLFMRQQASASGVSTSSYMQGASCSSSSTNYQLGSHNIGACSLLGSVDPSLWRQRQQQQQQQAYDPLLACMTDATVPAQLQAVVAAGGGNITDMCQLVQSLVAEVVASKQEAVQSSRAAVDAQQKLQLLEQLVGASVVSASSGLPTDYAALPVTSPHAIGLMQGGFLHAVATGTCTASSAQQQLQATAMHLQHPSTAAGAYDVFPRRHSLDESLLRRARHLPLGAFGGFPRGGVGGWPGAASSSQPGLAAVVEGVVSGASTGSAATDIALLTAALASADGHSSAQQHAVAGDVCVPAAGLALDGSMLVPTSGITPLRGASDSWVGVVPAAGVLQPTGMLTQSGDLQAMQHTAALSSQQLLDTRPLGSFQVAGSRPPSSAGIPQLQSDYLVQLQALLQAGAPSCADSGVAGRRGAVGASYEVDVGHIPFLPGDALGNVGANAADGGLVAEDMAGVSGSSLNNCSGGPLASDQLLSTTDGANQLGWF